MLRYACMEADCEAVVEAADEDALVEAVNAHFAERHDSYELDDVILASAEEVSDAG